MQLKTSSYLFAAALLPIVACQRGADPAKVAADKSSGRVVAFVAASTQDAVREIASAFNKDNRAGIKVNADDSGKLAMQIGADAPADLFLSANEKWADFVKEKGFVAETKVLLGTALVLVVPKGNPAGVKEPKDLLKREVKHVGIAGATVPAGIYARQALEKAQIWSKLQEEKKLVPGENVRVTLAYVERGEVEAGIVYATDAKIADQVEVVYTFAGSDHDPIRYPLVLLRKGQENRAARAFFAYLQTPPAAAIFKKFGFIMVGE